MSIMQLDDSIGSDRQDFGLNGSVKTQCEDLWFHPEQQIRTRWEKAYAVLTCSGYR